MVAAGCMVVGAVILAVSLCVLGWLRRGRMSKYCCTRCSSAAPRRAARVLRVRPTKLAQDEDGGDELAATDDVDEVGDRDRAAASPLSVRCGTGTLTSAAGLTGDDCLRLDALRRAHHARQSIGARRLPDSLGNTCD